MVDIARHPLLKECYEVCRAIEECGASDKLTDAVTKASALLQHMDAVFSESLPSTPNLGCDDAEFGMSEHRIPDSERGLYGKYDVRRVNDPIGKHDDCTYFILDWTHDKYSADAVEAYARACVSDFPSLAIDLLNAASDIRVKHNHHIYALWPELHRELAAAKAQLSIASGIIHGLTVKLDTAKAQLAEAMKEGFNMSNVMTPVPRDNPLMIAWELYKATDEYANTRKWAADVNSVDGSLWAAFSEGYQIAEAQLTTVRDDMKEECAKVCDREAGFADHNELEYNDKLAAERAGAYRWAAKAIRALKP